METWAIITLILIIIGLAEWYWILKKKEVAPKEDVMEEVKKMGDPCNLGDIHRKW